MAADGCTVAVGSAFAVRASVAVSLISLISIFFIRRTLNKWSA